MTVGRINHETNHDIFSYWASIIRRIFFYLLNSLVSICDSSVKKATSMLGINLRFSLTLTQLYGRKGLAFKPLFHN